MKTIAITLGNPQQKKLVQAGDFEILTVRAYVEAPKRMNYRVPVGTVITNYLPIKHTIRF